MTQASPDARLQTAISHWAHRFFANGVIPADYHEVTASLTSWDEWCAAWSKRAAVHEALGREALAAGHSLSAGEHLTRAGLYYHFAKFLFVQDMAEMRATHRKAVECRALALPHLAPPGERAEIPYDGKYLAGILRRPVGMARSPVVVMAMGLDSCKEEVDAYEQTFLDRGMATLAFDGPGQGEAEYDLPIRGDYEIPVKAVLDWLSARPDIDAARIGIWGVSLGGYYAPRAAAFDKRIKACVALSGPYDWSDCWDGLPELTRAAFHVRSHATSGDEARQKASALTLKGVAKQITCPLFLVAGKLDRIVPWEQAQRLAREAAGPVELLLVDEGTHVVNNRPHRYRTQTADWMGTQLRIAP
jgi:2,6-dihydroxypseudooxynicotine hydrolase